jgi:hypothetical protein
MALFGPSMAAEVRGIPRIGVMPNIYILPARGLPPMGPGFMPGVGLSENFAMASAAAS